MFTTFEVHCTEYGVQCTELEVHRTEKRSTVLLYSTSYGFSIQYTVRISEVQCTELEVHRTEFHVPDV